MRTIAVGIHKGGTGKTTMAFNLGHELARSGRRVLLVDLDYQAWTERSSSNDALGGYVAGNGKLAEGTMMTATEFRRVNAVELYAAQVALTAKGEPIFGLHR